MNQHIAPSRSKGIICNGRLPSARDSSRGVILLIVPRGSPWEGLTIYSRTVIARVVPETWNIASFGVCLIHLALSIVYGVIVSWTVVNIHQMRAVVVGGVVGLILYMLNFFVVRLWIPALAGNEAPVVVIHAVFGLIAAGACRGLLSWRVPARVEKT